jgi:scyllo-inositol 2-dehydrogenase (NADP+)
MSPVRHVEQVCADPDVDLVVLATPSNVHAGLSVQALEAGKNVVTDKVMCLSLAECDRMIAAAEGSGKLLTVFQNRRWDGDFLTLRQLISDGDLGDVKWIEMAWQGFGPWGGWRGKAAMGGGRFYDLGAHLIDQMCLLFPQPIEVRLLPDAPRLRPGPLRHRKRGARLRHLRDGRTGVCDLSGMAAISKPRFYAKGDRATFQKFGLDPQENAMKAGDIDSATEDPANYGRLKGPDGERTAPTLPGRWRNFYENIADVLVRGAAPAVTLPSVRRQIGVMDAALRSAQTGQVVRLEQK